MSSIQAPTSPAERAERELRILEQVGQILGDGLQLGEVFQRGMTLLSRELGVLRSSLMLTDPMTESLRTVAATGMTKKEQDRGNYAIGEGVTGQVLATGEAAVVPDVSKDENFLNRVGTEALTPDGAPLSYICVPIISGQERLGAISMVKPFPGTEDLAGDVRLLRIIAGSFSQTVKTHNLLASEKAQWLEENQRLREDLTTKYKFDNIIGQSPVMLDVLSTVAQVAPSRATVLILGETGCGKELIAKAIHYNSPRKDKPLIRVNCGALAPQLLESELFGHVQGAFTGAMKDKVGRFEAADGGTIFLDEIGTLDPQMQVKLLRVLQERELERVGDHKTVRVDCRVIAATNLDLEHEVRQGAFREDLYYRLNVVTVNIPPLRSRREDIPKLIDHFLYRYNAENGKSITNIGRDVMNTLLRYPWPGNVREIENAVERAVVLATGDDFALDLLPLQIKMYAQQTRRETSDQSVEGLSAQLAAEAVQQFRAFDGEVYSLVIKELERHLVREALDLNGGVKLRTADFLGLNRNTLNKKVKELGLDED